MPHDIQQSSRRFYRFPLPSDHIPGKGRSASDISSRRSSPHHLSVLNSSSYSLGILRVQYPVKGTFYRFFCSHTPWYFIPVYASNGFCGFLTCRIFFSTCFRGSITWCPHPKHFRRKSIPVLRISHSLLPQGCCFLSFIISPTNKSILFPIPAQSFCASWSLHLQTH